MSGRYKGKSCGEARNDTWSRYRKMSLDTHTQAQIDEIESEIEMLNMIGPITFEACKEGNALTLESIPEAFRRFFEQGGPS